MYDRILIMVSW